MSKPNQKKAMLYGLLLSGAVIGLLFDRMRATGSVTAPVVALAGSAGVSPVAAASTPVEVKGPAIARVFTIAAGMSGSESRPAEAEVSRDAFNLTPKMRKFYADASPARKAEEARNAESDEELRRQELDRFQSAHKLKGTSLREGGAWAMIDSNVVRIGEQIDGFELRRIERYRVELTKGGLLATLSLPMP
jgi:hypothetical protein